MNDSRNQYTYNIKWSIIEAIIFQSFLFAHQYILFKANAPAMYGLIGSLFGMLYFLIKAFDLGINKALVSFYNDYLKEKNSAHYFLYYQLQPSIAIYCIALTAVLIIKKHFTSTIPLLESLDYSLISMFFGLVATEGIKSIIKKILQLSNHFRHVALWEISFIACYQTTVWIYYYQGHPLTVHFVFGSFFILSTIETLGLLLWGYRWLKALPHSNILPQPNNTIIKNRLFAYSHTMGKQIFSANILVPLFAYLFGLELAAILKLASYMIHSITSIIERIIDPTSSAFFVNIRDNTTQEKENNFLFSSHLLYHILLCIFIFISINGMKLLNVSQHTHSSALLYIIIYFCIHYIETFFITIERFYIAHGRSEFLFISTACNAFLALIIFLFSPSPLLVLFLLLFLRLLYFFTLKIYMVSLWNINHHISIRPTYLIGSLVLSLFYFIIT